ncbi:MAG: baseplate J/gp47 family protein [Acidaminococcaceae bacterium]|uniref:baseplate J/gp47 family protein n=1 Tax=uncultured Succiniclasticum sp. TaxID=1500547 RepID=UPI001B7A31AC|nr:baseplate J/gp47 family protein [uncultured Succiniclasticum sp.]MBP3812306.1 baseplate J/gp47 family protein [Acidaminococcaceae bacterium]MBQ5345847.1 baseplate J/gp47 family protein [Acidaminococcaceae bacterium]
MSVNWGDMIGSKTFSELVTESRRKLGTSNSKITNWTIGGVFRTLVETACWCVSQLYSLMEKVVPMGFIEHATGRWLDLKVAEVGLVRRQAKRAKGMVIFSRTGNLGRAVKIPSGSIVKTEMQDNGQELRYFTTENVILPAGEASLNVSVQAEFEGAAYNVGEGYIRVLVTHIPGIDAITNVAEWIAEEGVDVESDEALRKRYKLRWHELSTGSTALAYQSWAYQVPGVMDVAIDDNHPRGPGTVDVIIASPAGSPTDALKREVKSYIDTRRPLCSDVVVMGPTLKPVDLDITLLLYPERGSLADTRTEAEQILQKFFTMTDEETDVDAQKIGDDFVRARLIRHLMEIQDVFNVVLTSPSADITVAVHELASRGTLDLKIERATET